MAKFNKRDGELLRCIAECHFLTIQQLGTLLGRSERGTANRLRELEEVGHVRSSFRHGKGRKGRPEKVAFLTSKGINTLRDNGVAIEQSDARRLTATSVNDLEHQLMVNAFRTSLCEMVRAVPKLTAKFLSPNSPFLPRQTDGYPFVRDAVPTGKGKGKRKRIFVPDGVCRLSHSEIGKTILFFLEADRGTEDEAEVRTKIQTYQAYLRLGGFKRYEAPTRCQLNGFRLLIVANSSARLQGLCRLTCKTRPSDFVWLTEEDRLVRPGLAGKIWARGGRMNRPPESILGSQAPDDPAE